MKKITVLYLVLISILAACASVPTQTQEQNANNGDEEGLRVYERIKIREESLWEVYKGMGYDISYYCQEMELHMEYTLGVFKYNEITSKGIEIETQEAYSIILGNSAENNYTIIHGNSLGKVDNDLFNTWEPFFGGAYYFRINDLIQFAQAECGASLESLEIKSKPGWFKIIWQD